MTKMLEQEFLATKGKAWEPTWRVNVVTNEDEAQPLIQFLQMSKIIAFDTEFNAETGMPVGMSFSVKPHTGWYVPFNHSTGEPQLLPTDIPELFGEIFNDESKVWVMHNAKAELHTMHKLGMEIKGEIFDTMVCTWMMHGTECKVMPGRSSVRMVGLKERAKEDLDPPMFWCTFKEVSTTYEIVEGSRRQITKGKDMGKWQIDVKTISLNTEEISITKMAPYATADAVATLRLYEVYKQQLDARSDRFKVAWDYEMRFVKVLFAMEARGVLLDKEYLENLRKELRVQREEARAAMIRACGGRDINLNSPKQKAEILFSPPPVGFGFTPKKETAKGAPSTDSETLEALIEENPDHPALKAIARYMELDKQIGTYLDAYLGLPEYVDNYGTKHKEKKCIIESDGRIHCDLRQTGTRTGRLSSADPNLQNIPTPLEEDKKIALKIIEENPQHHDKAQIARLLGLRGAFIAPEGRLMVVADYSQIELRILAHISQDPWLMQAYQEGKDVHQFCASIMHQIPYEEVTKDQRKGTKAINFGIIYGMGVGKLSRTLLCTIDEARVLYDSYYSNFVRVKGWIEQVHTRASRERQVQTLLGRIRPLPNIIHTDTGLMAQSKRQAVNTIIQGSAADIAMCAMIKIEHDNVLRELGYQMLLQVHDEVVGEVDSINAPGALKRVQELMESIVPLRVPIVAEGSCAQSWALAK